MSDPSTPLPREPGWKLGLRAAFRLLLLIVVFLALGRVNWTRAWALLGLLVVTIAVNLTVILLKNPSLLRERLKKQKPTDPRDKVFVTLSTLAWLGVMVVAGLDAVHYRWSLVSLDWLYVGAALHLLGMVPVAWAMATNPFLGATVRIQEERGHRVITTGPYRIVRHPMYVGILVMLLGWPVILGSWWSYVPLALVVLLILWRTAFEDRRLRKDLAGYDAYCRQTPYRLLPGVW